MVLSESVFSECKQPSSGTVAIKIGLKAAWQRWKKNIISQRTAVRLMIFMLVEGQFLPQKFPCNLSWLKTYYLLFKNTGKSVRRVSKISSRVRHILCGWHVKCSHDSEVYFLLCFVLNCRKYMKHHNSGFRHVFTAVRWAHLIFKGLSVSSVYVLLQNVYFSQCISSLIL